MIQAKHIFFVFDHYLRTVSSYHECDVKIRLKENYVSSREDCRTYWNVLGDFNKLGQKLELQ